MWRLAFIFFKVINLFFFMAYEILINEPKQIKSCLWLVNSLCLWLNNSLWKEMLTTKWDSLIFIFHWIPELSVSSSCLSLFSDGTSNIIKISNQSYLILFNNYQKYYLLNDFDIANIPVQLVIVTHVSPLSTVS